MPVITRSSHPDALWPGVMRWFGKKYAEIPTEWDQFFERGTSTKAFEKLAETTGFGLAALKTEGSSITYDADSEGYLTVLYNTVYGLGYIVTREEQEDDLYVEVSQQRARSLAFSMKTTIETLHANVLLNATSGSQLGGDGVALGSASHPTKSGNQSNLPTANADFSEAALEDMVKLIILAKNSRGLRINLRPEKILVSANDIFNATRVLESQLRVSTANNDINAIKAMGLFPGGVEMNHYLGSTNSFFLKTNAPDGLVSLWRREPQLEQDNDFDTENLKAKSTFRNTIGWGDWRGVWVMPSH